MIPLLWSLLNVVLLLAFLCAWGKALQLLWQARHPWLAAVLLVGSLGIGGASQVNNSSAAAAGSTQPAFLVQQQIHATRSLTWTLTGTYTRAADGLHQLTGTTQLAGFTSGLVWQPSGTMFFADGDTLRYAAAGNLEYQLLGTTIFRSQGQVFDGALQQ